MVYFIGNLEQKIVKIGCSYNPSVRLRDLQVGNPWELSILTSIEGSYKEEYFLHHKFKEFNLRNEWFSLSEEIVGFIENPIISDTELKASKIKLPTNTGKGITELEKEQLSKLYQEGFGNIEIANTLKLSINQVRNWVKKLKLARTRVIKAPRPTGYYDLLNKRKRLYKKYQIGKITKEELDTAIALIPPKKVMTKKPRFQQDDEKELYVSRR